MHSNLQKEVIFNFIPCQGLCHLLFTYKFIETKHLTKIAINFGNGVNILSFILQTTLQTSAISLAFLLSSVVTTSVSPLLRSESIAKGLLSDGAKYHRNLHISLTHIPINITITAPIQQ